MATPPTRQQQISKLFPSLPAFRTTQLERAFFDPHYQSFQEISSLPSLLRSELQESVPYISLTLVRLFQSDIHDTYKAILQTVDRHHFETVLMQNAKGDWTLCVSSQIGCAMRCTFCATGKMGLTRNLSSDEIVDQYRFWQQHLLTYNPEGRISNIVFMGMGEPLSNYLNVRDSITQLLRSTDLGKTKITVSTVGILPVLFKLLDDPQWPEVRIAISLHSARLHQRQQLMPTTTATFLQDLQRWSRTYTAKYHGRRDHVTFEYILLAGINDGPEDARVLARYVQGCGTIKVNVIPYNTVQGNDFKQSDRDRVSTFKKVLRAQGIDVTQRKTMGRDIAAACGQLLLQLQQ